MGQKSFEKKQYQEQEDFGKQKNSYGHYIVLVMLILLCLMGVRDNWAEDEDFIAVDPTLMYTTLVEYGYPQIVMDVLSEGTKLRIYEEKLYFDSAQLAFYKESGEKLHQITIQGSSDGLQLWSVEDEPTEYDVAVALVIGFCYENSEMSHAMCSFNYRWQSMPQTRKDDHFQMLWEPNQMWLVDDSFCWDRSQWRNDGTIRTLRYDQTVARVWSGGTKWYAELESIRGPGSCGISGGGLISMEPRDEIKSVVIKGVYNHFYNERPMLEAGDTVEYPIELELQWP